MSVGVSVGVAVGVEEWSGSDFSAPQCSGIHVSEVLVIGLHWVAKRKDRKQSINVHLTWKAMLAKYVL